jgi:tetratricopeptide (TPR) repeat protein
MNNPLVAQLGLLNEPGNSNTVLVRPDGTIAASLSSLNRHNETIANIIEWHDEKAVIDALTAGNIEEAKRIAFLRAPTEPPVSTDPKKKNVKPIPPSLTHLRARALVYLALQEYDKALADIEQVISLQLGTDGGMSLRTKDLEEAEQFRDQLLKLRAPKKEEK